MTKMSKNYSRFKRSKNPKRPKKGDKKPKRPKRKNGKKVPKAKSLEPSLAPQKLVEHQNIKKRLDISLFTSHVTILRIYV